MFHDIQWVFESLSSKSLFYSFRAWFHQSIDSAKFVQLPLERSPALQSLPSTRAPTASAQIWLTLKLMTRHGSDRQVAAASSSRKGLHFQGVAQIPAAGTSPGDLLERHVVRCPPPHLLNQRPGDGAQASVFSGAFRGMLVQFEIHCPQPASCPVFPWCIIRERKVNEPLCAYSQKSNAVPR